MMVFLAVLVIFSSKTSKFRHSVTKKRPFAHSKYATENAQLNKYDLTALVNPGWLSKRFRLHAEDCPVQIAGRERTLHELRSCPSHGGERSEICNKSLYQKTTITRRTRKSSVAQQRSLDNV